MSRFNDENDEPPLLATNIDDNESRTAPGFIFNDQYDQKLSSQTSRNIPKPLSNAFSKTLSNLSPKSSNNDSDIKLMDNASPKNVSSKVIKKSKKNVKSTKKSTKTLTSKRKKKNVTNTSNPRNDSKLLIILLGTHKTKQKTSDVDLRWCQSMNYTEKDYAENSWVGYITVQKKKEFPQYINDNKQDKAFYEWCNNAKYFRSKKNSDMTRFDDFAAYMIHEHEEFDEPFKMLHKTRCGPMYFNSKEHKTTLDEMKKKNPKLVELEERHDVLYIGLTTAVSMIGLMLSGKKDVEIRGKSLTNHVPLLQSNAGTMRLEEPPIPKKTKYIKKVPTRSDMQGKKRESQKPLISTALKEARSRYTINWNDLSTIIMHDYTKDKVLSMFGQWIYIKDLDLKNQNKSIKEHNNKLMKYCEKCLNKLQYWSTQSICKNRDGSLNDKYKLLQNFCVILFCFPDAMHKLLGMMDSQYANLEGAIGHILGITTKCRCSYCGCHVIYKFSPTRNPKVSWKCINCKKQYSCFADTWKMKFSKTTLWEIFQTWHRIWLKKKFLHWVLFQL